MKLKISTLILNLLLVAPYAQSQVSEFDSMPVMLGTACDYQLRTPPNSMGYIPSGDCKTVFVLPSIVGKLQLGAFAPTAHTLLCPAVNEYQQNRVDSLKALRELNGQLKKTNSSKARKEIEDKMAVIGKYMNLGGDVFKNKPSAHAQLLFSNAIDQGLLDQWALLNMEVIRSKGVVFRAAPISTSVLTFSAPQTIGIDEGAILYSSIPSLTKQTDGSYKTALFNGSLGGEVIFSLYGGCPLLNKLPQTMTDISALTVDPLKVGASLVANHSYEVPTRSKMKYKATLKKNDAIEFLNNFQKERGNAFTVSELVERHGSGDISDIVDLQISVSEMNAAQIENWNAFRQNFNQDVLTRLSDRMVKELATLKLIELRPAVAEEAPQAGTIQVPIQQRQCSSSSKYFGLSSSSSCGDVTVFIPVQVSGQSSLLDSQSLNQSIEISEKLEINEPFNYSFTSGFKPQAN